MKKVIVCLVFLGLLSSCNVTETIVFNEDGSGEFLVGYDMGEMMKQLKDTMGDSEAEAIDDDGSDKKEQKKVMDTTMIFADLIKTYKDSIPSDATAEELLALEYIKDMYMTMQVDEENDKMNMGIGLKFKSMEELKGIGDKIKEAQKFSGNKDKVEAAKTGSQMGKFMGNDDAKVDYDYNENGFTRITNLPVLTEEETEAQAILFSEDDESDMDFMKYFESSFYTVKLVFPKRIKSVDVEGAVISEDGKSVTYKTSWVDYIKNPQTLDVDVKFYE